MEKIREISKTVLTIIISVTAILAGLGVITVQQQQTINNQAAIIQQATENLAEQIVDLQERLNNVTDLMRETWNPTVYAWQTDYWLLSGSQGSVNFWYWLKAPNGTVISSWTSTNATTLFNRTIDGSTAGDIIELGKCTYNLDGSAYSIQVDVDKLTIRGQGAGTILNCTDNQCIVVWNDYATLSDFNITMAITGTANATGIGNWGNGTVIRNVGITAGGSALVLKGDGYALAERVTVYGCGNHGITVEGTEYNTVKDCIVYKAGDTGIQAYQSANYTNVENCLVVNATNDSFTLSSVKGCQFKGITAIDGRTGLYIGAETAQPCTDNLVLGYTHKGNVHDFGTSDGCSISMLTGSGVYNNIISVLEINIRQNNQSIIAMQSGANNNTISQGKITKPDSGQGFISVNGKWNNFESLQLYGANSGTYEVGIQLNATCNFTKIVNVDFFNIKWRDIYIVALANYTSILGCNDIGGTEFLNDAGTGTQTHNCWNGTAWIT